MTKNEKPLLQMRKRVLKLVLDRGYERREEPFQLSSGEWSHDYIDGKRALSRGSDLRLVAEAVLALTQEHSISFEAVGGLTMGADALSHAVSLITGCDWFSVRKEAKEHGKQKLLEGADIARADVLLVDDIVTTGSSILRALRPVKDSEATVTFAVCLVDRGDTAKPRLAEAGITYEPLLTYRDLKIEPVRLGRVPA